MLKNDLRLKYTSLRNDISQQSLLHSSLTIANKLLALSIWNHKYYHIFLPIAEKKEIDTSFIVSILQGKDKNVLIPKVVGAHTLKHYLLTDGTKFKMSKWGIPEPVDGIEISENEIDVVFVPLLAFDKKGNRVGYGKGFYDSFLKDCKEKVVKIGLSLFEAEETISDVDPHDIQLNYCITPKKIYSFSNT